MTADDKVAPRHAQLPFDLASVVIALFAGLLASFPTRSTSLFVHLADGRDLLTGRFESLTTNWLYDLVNSLLYRIGGDGGVIGFKVLTVVAMAVVLYRTAQVASGWVIPFVAVGLAVLASSMRLMAQPSTLSYVMLAIALHLVLKSSRDPSRAPRVLPSWPLLVTFAIWANLDPMVWVGVIVIGLTWLGEAFDRRSTSGTKGIVQSLGSIAILAGISALNPAYLHTIPTIADVLSIPTTDSNVILFTSPLAKAYWQAFQSVPAVLAYYPLLVLSAVSFLLVLSRWRWMLFLPWVAVTALSVLEARTIPLFAIVAGPALAWNLYDYFARRPITDLIRPTICNFATSSLIVVGMGMLVSAWPGWLQTPPYEPRRWVVENPVAYERGAAFLRAWTQANSQVASTKTLHVAAETQSVFRWFYPEDQGVFDAKLATDLANVTEDPSTIATRLQQLGITRIVLYPSLRGPSTAILNRLLVDRQHWPLLHLDSGLVILGYRPDDKPSTPDPFAGHTIDVEQFGFHPPADKIAPVRDITPVNLKPDWRDAFRQQAPPRPADRDEAATWLQVADASRLSAPIRHLEHWELLQVTGLLSAPASWSGPLAFTDAAVRFTLMRPPVQANVPAGTPVLPITQQVFTIQKRFVLHQGDVSPAILYSAIRSARQSLKTNPNDAATHLLLAKCYILLQESSQERKWGQIFPQYIRLRRVQATAALYRAIELNPQLTEAHMLLSHLFRSVGCVDLALDHLRSYLQLTKQLGQTGTVKSNTPVTPEYQEYDELQTSVNEQLKTFTADASRSTVADRALLAARRGLIGKAREILLSSDVSAFGMEGTKLELELLLVTGRAARVLEMAIPEIRDTVGRPEYHWLRAQAHAATGEYEAAEAELANLAVDPKSVSVQQVASAYAQLVGTFLLEERLGMQKTIGVLITNNLGRMDFQSNLTEYNRILSKRSDASALQGLIFLEAGEIDRAETAFRTALMLSTTGKDGLAFPGRTTAYDALRWIAPPTKKE